MSLDSTLGRRLSMFKSMESKITVELKSAKHKPFNATVKGFHYDEEEDKVEFGRLDDTVFPGDSENEKQETYTTYIKNIKSVERIKE